MSTSIMYVCQTFPLVLASPEGNVHLQVTSGVSLCHLVLCRLGDARIQNVLAVCLSPCINCFMLFFKVDAQVCVQMGHYYKPPSLPSAHKDTERQKNQLHANYFLISFCDWLLC